MRELVHRHAFGERSRIDLNGRPKVAKKMSTFEGGL